MEYLCMCEDQSRIVRLDGVCLKCGGADAKGAKNRLRDIQVEREEYEDCNKRKDDAAYTDNQRKEGAV